MLFQLSVRVCFVIAALAAGSACVIDTLPMPEGEGRVPANDDFEPSPGEGVGVSSGALFWSAGDPGLLVGAEDAAPPAGRVAVENPARGNWRGEIDVEADGSFNMPLHAAEGDVLAIEVHMAGALVSQDTFTVAAASSAALAANADLGAVGDPNAVQFFTVSAPDAQGMVEVTGTTHPGIVVVVANLTLGPATVAPASTLGEFAAVLLGRSGDELALFTVEPASSNGGSAPQSALVP